MSFFISDAMAQQAAGAGPESGLAGLIPLVFIFIIFYFLLLRPQMKRAKEHKKMTEALAKNDEVVTNGGIAGRIVKVEDNFVTLQIAENVQVQVQRNALGSLLPKGTVKFKE
jgi:preprotein translocase subunit YajC